MPKTIDELIAYSAFIGTMSHEKLIEHHLHEFNDSEDSEDDYDTNDTTEQLPESITIEVTDANDDGFTRTGVTANDIRVIMLRMHFGTDIKVLSSRIHGVGLHRVKVLFFPDETTYTEYTQIVWIVPAPPEELPDL